MQDWDQSDDAFLAFIGGFLVQAFASVIAGFALTSEPGLVKYGIAILAFGAFGAGLALTLYGVGYFAISVAKALYRLFNR